MAKEYSPLKCDEPSTSITLTRKERLKRGANQLYIEMKDVVIPLPPTATAGSSVVTVQYPLHGGFTGQMSIEVAAFPELDCPPEIAYGTMLAINRCLKAHGPRFHLPIYIAGTALLVTTGWGGLVVGVIGAIYFGIKKRRAKRAVRDMLNAENARPEYTTRGIRWFLTDRGVEVEQTRASAPPPAAMVAPPTYSVNYTAPPFYTPAAPAPAPVAAPPSLYPSQAFAFPTKEAQGKWGSELEQLRAMGYYDDARSIALLQQHNGRVPAVVEALLA